MSATLVKIRSEFHFTATIEELNSSQKSALPINLIYQTTSSGTTRLVSKLIDQFRTVKFRHPYTNAEKP